MTVGSLLRIKWPSITVLVGNHHHSLIYNDIVILFDVKQHDKNYRNNVEVMFISKFGFAVTYFDVYDLKLAFTALILN
jgi:hypothetical protein